MYNPVVGVRWGQAVPGFNPPQNPVFQPLAPVVQHQHYVERREMFQGRPHEIGVRLSPLGQGAVTQMDTLFNHFHARTAEFSTRPPNTTMGHFRVDVAHTNHYYTSPLLNLDAVNMDLLNEILADIAQSGEEPDVTEVEFVFVFFYNDNVQARRANVRGGAGGKRLPDWVKVTAGARDSPPELNCAAWFICAQKNKDNRYRLDKTRKSSRQAKDTKALMDELGM